MDVDVDAKVGGGPVERERMSQAQIAALVSGMVSGWTLLVLGAVLGDMEAHGVVTMTIGGVVIVLTITALAMGRPPVRPPVDEAELLAIVHDQLASHNERVTATLERVVESLRRCA